MKTFMFPGQGSQTQGMGRGLFERFRSLTAQADAVLGYGVEQLCLEDPRREIDQTQFTQPAIFVVNALSYLQHVEDTGEQPDFLIGHSLGELSALFAAGSFDFVTGLRLVKKRGELMSQARGGGMAAILNASHDEIRAILNAHELSQVQLANFNTPQQIVISGPREEIIRAEACFRDSRSRFVPLNTSGAFHSALMAPARHAFAAHLESFEIGEPRIPVVANVTARPHVRGAVADALSRQITSPVRWVESICHLLEIADGAGATMEFRELGPGTTLTRLVDKIVSWHEKVRARAGDAEQRVRSWNANYGIGTKVRSWNPEYDDLETSSEALLLLGHRAVIYMRGFEGYFDMREVEPL